MRAGPILDSANIINPGGDIRTGVERIALEPTGNFESVADLRRTVVSLPGRPETVFLEDLAEISRGYVEPPASRVFASGTPALALGIAMRDGGNIITLGDEVSRELERLEAGYPIGIEFGVVAFQPEVVARKVRDFVVNLGQAVVAGLLVANSYFGFMTLLGILALAGIIINNAIVLIDRIRIEIDDNRLDPPRAVVEAAQGRFRPILLTTATTVAGLLPLWFGGGPMWEPMAIAIIFGLLGATVLTLGVVPILYSLLFRVRFDGFRY